MKTCPGITLRWWVAVALAALAAAHTSTGLVAQDAAGPNLDKAVAALRNIDPAAMSDEQKQAKAKEIGQAWEVFLVAGKGGAARLKQEIQALDEAGQVDHYFRLGAASLLWQISSLDEAPTIAAQWRASRLSANYNYVFFVAFEAAKTQDPRAVEMLKACLADDQGSVFIPDHVLRIGWPLSHSFLWETYGPKGLPVLLEVLKTSDHPVELRSAAILLTRAQAIEALPVLRERLLKHADAEVRRMAVRCIGIFGHPDDYEMLVAGLKSEDPQDVWYHLFALYEYEDLRAVPHVAPLLASASDEVRSEAMAVLTHLQTRESLEAIRALAGKAPNDREKAEAERFFKEVVEAAGLSAAEYDAKSAAERDTIVAGLRARRNERYVMKPDDRKLTHAELVEAAAGWQTAHRITGGKFEWVEDRHVLSVATPADLNLLRQVQASLYWRVSDECLTEVRVINGLIERIGRSRYRSDPGVCDKVSPPAGKAP
jgi:HEAT repeat protein